MKRGWLGILMLLICATSAGAHPHQWCWTEVDHPNVDGYRVRYTLPDLPLCWANPNMVEVSAAQACTEFSNTPGVCCDGGLVLVDESEPLPGELIFFVITAFNEHGESSTEHGEILAVCP